MESPTSGADGVRRMRPVKRACIDCHARKVKCDGASNGFPCSNCKSANVHCAVAERRKRRRLSEKPVNDEERSQSAPRSDTRRRVRGSSASAEPFGGDAETRNGERLGSSRFGPSLSRIVESGSATPAPDEGDEEQNRDDDDPGSDAAADYAGEYELAKQHLVNFFSQDLQDNPIRARSTYVGSELSNLNYLTRQRAADQHVHHYPCSNIYVPRGFRNNHTLATPNLIPKDAFVVPPRHVSDVLVTEYFAHVHPMFPVLDRDRFLTLYHDAEASPSILLLHVVCLAGSHVTRTYRNNKQDLKVAFFRRAKALLDGRYEEDRMNVVQAALLLTWFSDGGDDICANAWWWIGLAARTAIGLGMHREVGPSKMPPSDKRIWRMIWWCLVQFDCMVSLCYGRPQNINLDDCDVPPLEMSDFDSSISERQAQAVINHAKLCTLITDLVRSHFSVRVIKSGIISRRAAVEAVDDALAQWLVELPPYLRDRSTKTSTTANTDEDGDRCYQSSVMLLHLTYNAVLIQFHRFLSNERSSGPTGNGNRNMEEERMQTAGDKEICAEAASNIIQIFERLGATSGLRCCCFWAPHALFTAMLEVSGQLKSLNPILAVRSKEKYESGLRSMRRLTRYWLFATSVLRLFESNSIKPPKETATIRGRASPVPGDQISPEQESPLATLSSAGAVSTNGGAVPPYMAMGQEPGQQQQQTMDWVQMFSYGDPNIGNMHVERNRWQNSLEEWQSIYWSDPLDNIRLEDNFGQFQYEWQAQ